MQMANTPSIGNYVIDLFLTRHTSLVDKCVSIPSLSYHDAELLDISTIPCNYPIKCSYEIKLPTHHLGASVPCLLLTSFFNDAKSYWTVLRSNVIQLRTSPVPKKTTPPKSNECMNTETRGMVHCKIRAFSKDHATKSPRNF